MSKALHKEKIPNDMETLEDTEKISAKKVFLFLLYCSFTLILLHLISFYLLYFQNYTLPFLLIDRFDLDNETSIATWFSSIILLFAAVLSWAVAYFQKTKDHIKKWKVLSILFIYMSLDEGSMIHEIGEDITMSIFELKSSIFYFSWWVLSLPLIFFTIIYFFKFWLSLPKRTKWLFFVAASLFLGGVIGVEILTGVHVKKNGFDNFLYSVLAVFEEGFEMLGTSVFIYALLDYLSKGKHKLRTSFSS